MPVEKTIRGSVETSIRRPVGGGEGYQQDSEEEHQEANGKWLLGHRRGTSRGQ